MTVSDLSAASLEKSLIGALVFDRDAIVGVTDRITPEAFSDPRWRAIYQSVQRCWEKRVPPDIVSVHNELANDPMYADEGNWQSAVLDISDALSHVNQFGWFTHAPHYADAVVDHARRRAVREAGVRLVEASASGGGLDPDMVMHEAMSSLDRFGATTERAGPQAYADIIPDYLDHILKMRSGEIPNRVTSTGLVALDHKLSGGFYPGELVILAARPSMGKTALALQLAHNVARRNRHTIVFSAEMSKESLIKRAVSEVSGQAIERSEHELNDNDIHLFTQTLDRLARMPLMIDDTPGITTAQMLVRVQAVQRIHEVGLVVFDYIELAGDQTKSDSEERRINDIVKSLKKLARVCDIPVVALCQLNRNVESRQNKRPMLADLRYSGSIEQDADKVLFLYRHDYYVNQGTSNEEPDNIGIAEVIVSKHRNGPTGEVRMRFQSETMKFFDIDERGAVIPF